MKKLKLFTALATAGMTTGILLPLVTSCNVATTGEIKFKLEEGITAKADPFKVGDKVVIKYTVTDKDATVTADNITVKFDGWKVQTSNKTWKLDRANKKIIIFNAPTTDITVKISLGSYVDIATSTVYFAESTEYEILDNGGNKRTSIEVPASTTYQKLFADYITVHIYDQSNGEHVGYWEANGEIIDDETKKVTNNATLEPFIEAGGFVSNSFNISVSSDESIVEGSFGKLYSGSTSETQISKSYDDFGGKTYSQMGDTLVANGEIAPFPGCKIDKWLDSNGNDVSNQTVSSNIGNVTVQFGYSDYKTLYLSWNATDSAFNANIPTGDQNGWQTGDVVTVIFDCSTMNDDFTGDPALHMVALGGTRIYNTFDYNSADSFKIYEYDQESQQYLPELYNSTFYVCEHVEDTLEDGSVVVRNETVKFNAGSGIICMQAKLGNNISGADIVQFGVPRPDAE